MKQGTNRDLGISERFMAGSLAGAISQSVIYPMEVSSLKLLKPENYVNLNYSSKTVSATLSNIIGFYYCS